MIGLSLTHTQNGVDRVEIMNGVVEQNSKDLSPIPSPTASRRGKGSLSSTLLTQNHDSPVAQLEGFLHRKHEWEGHNKKASSRYGELDQKRESK